MCSSCFRGVIVHCCGENPTITVYVIKRDGNRLPCVETLTEMARCFINVEENDLMRLNSDNCLNGILIDSYLRLMERRSHQSSNWLKLQCLDTYFLTSLANKRFGLADGRFKKMNPFEVDLILAPLHIPKPGHWALITAEPRRNIIRAYDSLGKEHYEHMSNLYKALRAYALANEIEWNPNWVIHKTSDQCPKQDNLYDCGVFVTWFAERLSRGMKDMPDQPFHLNTFHWRNHMMSALETQVLTEHVSLSEQVFFPEPKRLIGQKSKKSQIKTLEREMERLKHKIMILEQNLNEKSN